MTPRRHSGPGGSDHTPPAKTPRLRLKPKAPVTGYVDGAWWPHSDELLTELPDLLAVLSVRLGSIDRVTYNLAEWAQAPVKMVYDDRLVRLAGYTRQPVNTIEVIGATRKRVVLLVVPAGTDSAIAHDTMMAAASPSNSLSVERLLAGAGLE
jgi:hypothetical protein